MEHARNPDEYMAEINRVLKPADMRCTSCRQMVPAIRTALFVPLANFFWPKCPTWWFVIWALLGRRNAFQREQDWRTVVATNRAYYDSGLIYLTTRNTTSSRADTSPKPDGRWILYRQRLRNAPRVARHLPFEHSGAGSRANPDGFPSPAQGAGLIAEGPDAPGEWVDPDQSVRQHWLARDLSENRFPLFGISASGKNPSHQADNDQIDGDDVIEQARHDEKSECLRSRQQSAGCGLR